MKPNICLLFRASLESDHSRNCSSGNQPPPQTTRSSSIYSRDAENLFEGVTLCPMCNGRGHITRHNHAGYCPTCNGDTLGRRRP